MRNFLDFLRNHELAFLAIAAVSLTVICAAVVIDARTPKAPSFINFVLDGDYHVVAEGIYRNGDIKVENIYTTSTEQGMNPLQDPLYAGYAPIATCYDPMAMFAVGEDTALFAYNRGVEAGDCGWTRFSEDGQIMQVIFKNGVVSWVDKEGVIASAVDRNGEIYVAFYDRTAA